MGHLRPPSLKGRAEALVSSQRQLWWGLRALSARAAVTGECHPLGSRQSPGSRNVQTRRWRGDLTHQPHHFSGLGVASQRLLEKMRRPSTSTSNTPPEDWINFTSA